MKTLLTTIIIALFTLSINAQERISFAAYQDIKLATIGDKEHNYDAITTDVVLRLKLQGKQQRFGFLTIFPEFEYADLKTAYKRYSFNVGYTLNRLPIEKLNFNAALGYGIIDRLDASGDSFSITSEISYPITKNLRINLMGQATEREDLNILYNDETIKISGFLGLEFNLN